MCVWKIRNDDPKVFSYNFLNDQIDWYAGEVKKKCEEEINTSAEREIKIFHGPFITFFSVNDLLLAASYFRAKNISLEIKNHSSLSSE